MSCDVWSCAKLSLNVFSRSVCNLLGSSVHVITCKDIVKILNIIACSLMNESKLITSSEDSILLNLFIFTFSISLKCSPAANTNYIAALCRKISFHNRPFSVFSESTHSTLCERRGIKCFTEHLHPGLPMFPGRRVVNHHTHMHTHLCMHYKLH